MRRISVLGATGSIGASTLDLIRRQPDAWDVVALSANGNAVELAKLAREFGAKIAVVADESKLPELREALAGSGIEAGAVNRPWSRPRGARPTSRLPPLSVALDWPRPWPPSSRAAPWRWPTRRRWSPRAR
jgi:hypothetical protein